MSGCAKNGVEALVDHRTLEAQGIDRPPGEHDGPAVSAMKRKGRSSRRDEDQQQRQSDANQVAGKRQAAEAAHDQATSQRLLRRLRQEPNRIHGEDHGRRFERLDGLTREDRQGGRSVWRFKPQAGAKLGAVAVIDHGDSISIPKTSDSRIGAAIALAKEKGWGGVVLTGSDEFKQKAAQTAIRAGLNVENPEMQDYINKVRRKSEEQQKAPEAPTAPRVRPAATAQAPTLPGAQEEAFAGMSPAQLGDRLRQVEILLERQKAALKHADGMGYATQCNKEKHLKTQLAQAKAKVFEDGPMLREIFSAHLSLRFGEVLEIARADRQKAAAELQKLDQKHTLGRLLVVGQRRDLSRRIADAQRREQEAAERIRKIEKAAEEMKDPKMREAYRRWAVERMKVNNQDVERLKIASGAAAEERAAIERRANFSSSDYKRLVDEKKNTPRAWKCPCWR